jgi:hypothetical protein
LGRAHLREGIVERFVRFEHALVSDAADQREMALDRSWIDEHRLCGNNRLIPEGIVVLAETVMFIFSPFVAGEWIIALEFLHVNRFFREFCRCHNAGRDEGAAHRATVGIIYNVRIQRRRWSPRDWHGS